MALVAGWLEEKPAPDQLTSLDTVLFLTCGSSSNSGCKERCCQRRHRAFRLAPIPTGQFIRPGSRVSRIRLSFMKHEVIPAEDFWELNCMIRTLEVAIFYLQSSLGPHNPGGISQEVVMLCPRHVPLLVE